MTGSITVELSQVTEKVRQIRQELDLLLRPAANDIDGVRRAAEVTARTSPTTRTDDLAERARAIYATRRRRARCFDVGGGLFADPAWDILLDLYCNEQAGRTTSVSSACIAADIPSTSALRWINTLVRTGLVAKNPHPTDRRCTLLSLTDRAVQGLVQILSE